MSGIQTAEQWAEERRAEKLAPWLLLLMAAGAVFLVLWIAQPSRWHAELSVDGEIVIAESRMFGLSWNYYFAEYKDGAWYWNKGSGKPVFVPEHVLATLNFSSQPEPIPN